MSGRYKMAIGFWPLAIGLWPLAIKCHAEIAEQREQSQTCLNYAES